MIKDYVHDFLGDFAAVVLGVCVGDGEIGVSYPVSQGEAIHAKIHELRDKFVYRGATLTTCDVDMLVVNKFQMPHPAPAQAPVVAPPVPVAPPGPSPLRASPNRRLVQKVFETTSVPPGLPDTPVLQ